MTRALLLLGFVFTGEFVFANSLGAEPRILFSKYFKGSVPESVFITVEQNGHVTYKEALDDERPIHFTIPDLRAAEIFTLAQKLNRFGRTLESPAKVAHMGFKTLRWEDGTANSETKYNFTEDADARQLQDWFEMVIETEQSYYMLERTVKFDKLGINQALLQLQMTYERKRLVAPEQFLPLLDRVVKNETIMHIARERAAALAESFRNPPQEKPAP